MGDVNNTENNTEPGYVEGAVAGLQRVEREGREQGEMEVTQGIIAQTLQSFKIDVQPGSMSRGPRFTRYEFIVPHGKSVKSVAYRSSDIMAATHSYSIRIHSPIPGKPTVGIELENAEPAPVFLRELVQGADFSRQKLPLALGVDVCGASVVADLAELPHLLLSGEPGGGVEEGLRALLLGLLCKCRPHEMGFILIDPTDMILNSFANLSHLLAPLISEIDMTAKTLRWCIGEMTRRYQLFARAQARFLAGYNATCAPKKRLPYLVVVVAELGYLMLDNREEMESYLLRLAAKARGAGIHIIVATQFPRSRVITDSLRMILPGRLAFRVGKAAASRAILDDQGAEELLGSGDALYRAPTRRLTRLQIPHVSPSEIQSVVDYYSHIS